MSSFKGHEEPIERGELYSLSLGKHRIWIAIQILQATGKCQSPAC